MLNWIVVGIGDISTRRVIPAIQAEPRSRLYGLVTRDAAKAAPYSVKSWATLEEALDDPGVQADVQAEVQAVYIATPPFLHAPQAIQSLRAGKHVLCEKPMAMNEAEARVMVDGAEWNKRLLGVAYYRRAYPKVRRAKELLAAGVIGQPFLAELTCHEWRDEESSRRSWLVDPAKAGGGPLYDIASHRIDVLNFLFGRPARATGFLSNLVHHYAVEDNATVMVDYESGVRGIVDARWHSHIRRDECRIRGTDGEIQMGSLNGPDLIYPGGQEHLAVHPNVHLPVIENFVEAAEQKTALLCSGADAYWTDWITGQVTGAKPG
ncbi:MAG TPA: Gfo/Idh/MocA family oxidoreductase [Candidatus Binatia bacterium]|nr:Gfo/Idh/MocA family oxidoreductase [Candidatus Binatia bacterium]